MSDFHWAIVWCLLLNVLIHVKMQVYFPSKERAFTKPACALFLGDGVLAGILSLL